MGVGETLPQSRGSLWLPFLLLSVPLLRVMFHAQVPFLNTGGFAPRNTVCADEARLG